MEDKMTLVNGEDAPGAANSADDEDQEEGVYAGTKFLETHQLEQLLDEMVNLKIPTKIEELVHLEESNLFQNTTGAFSQADLAELAGLTKTFCDDLGRVSKYAKAWCSRADKRSTKIMKTENLLSMVDNFCALTLRRLRDEIGMPSQVRLDHFDSGAQGRTKDVELVAGSIAEELARSEENHQKELQCFLRVSLGRIVSFYVSIQGRIRDALGQEAFLSQR